MNSTDEADGTAPDGTATRRRLGPLECTADMARGREPAARRYLAKPMKASQRLDAVAMAARHPPAVDVFSRGG